MPKLTAPRTIGTLMRGQEINAERRRVSVESTGSALEKADTPVWHRHPAGDQNSFQANTIRAAATPNRYRDARLGARLSPLYADRTVCCSSMRSRK